MCVWCVMWCVCVRCVMCVCCDVVCVWCVMCVVCVYCDVVCDVCSVCCDVVCNEGVYWTQMMHSRLGARVPRLLFQSIQAQKDPSRARRTMLGPGQALCLGLQ